MKKILVVLMLFVSTQTIQAQKMRDVFAAMPDSVLTLLTKNNRLDCIDFIENNMEAKVRNRLDGFSVLEKLSDDYLSLKLTPVAQIEMKLLFRKDKLYSIAMAKTYAGPVRSTHLVFYTPEWKVIKTDEMLSYPEYTSFWKSDVHSDNRGKTEGLQKKLDIHFVTAAFSPDNGNLTFALQPALLEDKDSVEISKHLIPLVYQWNGKRFQQVKQ